MPRYTNDITTNDTCEAVGVWPVRVVIGGIRGWSLWCSGDTDVLLARDGRVQAFGRPATLFAVLTAASATFTPSSATSLDAAVLRRVLDAPAASFDLDAAARWFASSEREVGMEACDQALSAINMATDIGATVGDHRLGDLVSSGALSSTFDALTFGLTVLGEGSPFRDDPAAMVSAITTEAAEAAVWLMALAGSYVEAA